MDLRVREGRLADRIAAELLTRRGVRTENVAAARDRQSIATSDASIGRSRRKPLLRTQVVVRVGTYARLAINLTIVDGDNAV